MANFPNLPAYVAHNAVDPEMDIFPLSHFSSAPIRILRNIRGRITPRPIVHGRQTLLNYARTLRDCYEIDPSSISVNLEELAWLDLDVETARLLGFHILRTPIAPVRRRRNPPAQQPPAAAQQVVLPAIRPPRDFFGNLYHTWYRQHRVRVDMVRFWELCRRVQNLVNEMLAGNHDSVMMLRGSVNDRFITNNCARFIFIHLLSTIKIIIPNPDPNVEDEAIRIYFANRDYIDANGYNHGRRFNHGIQQADYDMQPPDNFERRVNTFIETRNIRVLRLVPNEFDINWRWNSAGQIRILGRN